MRIRLKDLSLQGVFIGAVADLVLTNLLVLPLVVITDTRIARETPGGKLAPAMFAHALATNKELYLVMMLLGALASIAAGWIAARVARRAEMLNGAASAIACASLGVYALFRYPEAAPLWEHVVFFILAPALGALGGLIYRRRPARAVASLATPPNEAPLLSVPAPGVQRAVFVANRLLMALAALTFLAFVVGGAFAYTQHSTSGIIGCALFCALALATGWLLVLGSRRLRRGFTNHWLLHAAAVVMLAIPVWIVVFGVEAGHAAKATATAPHP
jgi:hypothetical protein